ncbi:DUF1758 domain-containing protein [Trichonephila clavata]|uniref:DUF1758 domain-containing protein n=1 Tax=Trichonephila clavata TaxID=2740835 RepID=A0A8X6M5I9_TRICU|nr:DUF1758 domain-containing protein [Trichonephila clavata]
MNYRRLVLFALVHYQVRTRKSEGTDEIFRVDVLFALVHYQVRTRKSGHRRNSSKEADRRLEELIVEIERLDAELSPVESEIEDFEKRYFDLKLKLKDKIDAIDASRSINLSRQNISIATPTEQSSANFQLPKPNIPVFSDVNANCKQDTDNTLKGSVDQQEVSNTELDAENTTLNSSTSVNNAKCVSFLPTAKVLIYNSEGGSFLFTG